MNNRAERFRKGLFKVVAEEEEEEELLPFPDWQVDAMNRVPGTIEQIKQNIAFLKSVPQPPQPNFNSFHNAMEYFCKFGGWVLANKWDFGSGLKISHYGDTSKDELGRHYWENPHEIPLIAKNWTQLSEEDRKLWWSIEAEFTTFLKYKARALEELKNSVEDLLKYEGDLSELSGEIAEWFKANSNNLTLSIAIKHLDSIKKQIVQDVGGSKRFSRYPLSINSDSDLVQYRVSKARVYSSTYWAISGLVKAAYAQLKERAIQVEKEFAPTLRPRIEEHIHGSKFAKFLDGSIKYIFGQGLEEELSSMILRKTIDGIVRDFSLGSKLYTLARHGMAAQAAQAPVKELRDWEGYLEKAQANYKQVIIREQEHLIQELVEKHEQNNLHAGLATWWRDNSDLHDASVEAKKLVQSTEVKEFDPDAFTPKYFDLKRVLIDQKRYHLYSGISNNRASNKVRVRELPKKFANMGKDVEAATEKLREMEAEAEAKGMKPPQWQGLARNMEEDWEVVRTLPIPEIGQFAEKLTQSEARKSALDLEYNTPFPDAAWLAYKFLMPYNKEGWSTNTLGIHFMMKEDNPKKTQLKHFREFGLTHPNYHVNENDDVQTRNAKAKHLVEDLFALINHIPKTGGGERATTQISWLYRYVLPRMTGVSSQTKLKIADNLYPLLHSHFSGYDPSERKAAIEWVDIMISNPNIEKLDDVRVIKEFVGLFTEINKLKKQRNVVDYMAKQDPEYYEHYSEYPYDEYTDLDDIAWIGDSIPKEEKERYLDLQNQIERLELDIEYYPTDPDVKDNKEKLKNLKVEFDPLSKKVEEYARRAKEEHKRKEKEEWGFDGLLRKLKEKGMVDDRHLNAVEYVFNTMNNKEKISLDNPNELFSIARFAQVAVTAVSQYAGIKEYADKVEKKLPEVTESPNWEMPERGFRFRVFEDNDPQHFSIGAETNCCQILGGVGEGAAIDSFINKFAGVLVVEFLINGDWKIATQSYFHYVPEDKSYILDNVEHNEVISRQAQDITGMSVEELYGLWAEEMKDRFPGIKYIGVGKEYTVIDLSRWDRLDGLEEDPREFHDDVDPYSDFSYNNAIDLLKPKEFMKEETIENEEEVEEEYRDEDDEKPPLDQAGYMQLRDAVFDIWRPNREKKYMVPDQDYRKNMRMYVLCLKKALIGMGKIKGMDTSKWDNKTLGWIEKRLFGKKAFLQGLLIKEDWKEIGLIIRKARQERRLCGTK